MVMAKRVFPLVAIWDISGQDASACQPSGLEMAKPEP